MRADMKKVLTERPRHGHAFCYREVRRRENRGDFEDLPRNRGMRQPFQKGWNTKEFSDLIGPLRRYLWSCIGRPWNDVWSEVCGQLSNNTVDAHLKGHARDEVATVTFLRDGQVMTFGRYSSYCRPADGLFVHPETGLLCGIEPTAPAWRKAPRAVFHDGVAYERDEAGVLWPGSSRFGRKPARFPRKIIGPEQEMVRMEGVWYWVVFATVRRSLGHGMAGQIGVTDIVTGKTVTQGRYRAGKRQMSGRDLRRHGLTNQT